MVNLIEDILAWQKETFPRATEEAVLKKLMEEILELRTASLAHVHRESLRTEVEMLEEIADVFIVATRYIDMRSDGGVSILDIIEKKMDRNKRRTWGPETENGDRPRVK